jgi:2-phospho-L-lactate guanylyltransferase
VSRSATALLSDVHAVLPIHSSDAAKTRLGLALDPEERDVLVLGMFANTVQVLARWPSCRRIHVVTSDYAVTDVVARGFSSVLTVVDPGSGLNDALRAGRDAAVAAGATAVLMLPADLPLLDVASLDRLLDAADATIAAANGGPVVVIAPADARTGTNALLLAPPLIIEPQFGPESFAAHLRAAAGAEASVQIVDDALLGFDLDTPDDLERLDIARRLELEAVGDEIERELVFASTG